MHPTLNIALRAARSAADKLSYVSDNFPALMAEGDTKQQVIEKAMDDASYRVEKTITNAYDGVKVFFAHQAGPTSDDKDYWVINVLCGSKNFLMGFPYFCVIASQYANGRIENTAIVNPMDQNEFIASRGRGAQFKDKRIRCSNQRDISQAVIADFDGHAQGVKGGFSRITGCSVLDIAYSAASKIDAVYAKVEHPMELDAALLIANEAGCLSGSLTGATLAKGATTAIAANAKLFKQLIIK